MAGRPSSTAAPTAQQPDRLRPATRTVSSGAGQRVEAIRGRQVDAPDSEPPGTIAYDLRDPLTIVLYALTCCGARRGNLIQRQRPDSDRCLAHIEKAGRRMALYRLLGWCPSPVDMLLGGYSAIIPVSQRPAKR